MTASTSVDWNEDLEWPTAKLDCFNVTRQTAVIGDSVDMGYRAHMREYAFMLLRIEASKSDGRLADFKVCLNFLVCIHAGRMRP